MQKYLQCMKIFMFFSLVLFLFVVAHVEDSKPLLRPFWYRFFSITMFGVLIVVVVGVVGGVAWKRRNERHRKRFF